LLRSYIEMENGSGGSQTAPSTRPDEEYVRKQRRAQLRTLNTNSAGKGSFETLDSSLKRHTALIKRMKQSLGMENHDQIMKDIDSLSLEKYVEEISGAAVEGIARCKTEKDVRSAVEIISALHRRFPTIFTPSLIASLLGALVPTPKSALSGLSTEQREKEDSSRIVRQRPVIRVCAELALVGIIRDGPGKSGGEWIMKVIRDLVCGII